MIAAVEAAMVEAEAMLGNTLLERTTDKTNGEIIPLLTIVADYGGPFRSFRFQCFIATHPELTHVRTWARSPGQNGSRERGFGSLKQEKLYCEQIDDALERKPAGYGETMPTVQRWRRTRYSVFEVIRVQEAQP